MLTALFLLASAVIPPAAPAADRDGDPLPPRALARCGTLRHRHPDGPTHAAVSADGRRLATGASGDRRILLFAEAGARWQRVFDEGPRVLTGLAVSGDGAWVAASPAEGPVCLWSAVTGQRRDLDPGPYPLRAVAVAADGRWLAAATGAGKACLWETARGHRFGTIERTDGRDFRRVAIAPDGRTVAFASPGRVEWYAVDSLKLQGERGGLGAGVPVPAFTPDGRTLVLAPPEAPTMTLVDAATGQPRGERPRPAGTVLDLAWAPDGAGLAFLTRDGGAHQLHWWAGEPAREVWRQPAGQATRLAVPAAGPLWCSPPGPLAFDRATGRPLQTSGPAWEPPPANAPGRVEDLAFSPDGRLLASAGPGGVKVWSAAGGELVRAWPGLPGVRHLRWDADGRQLALAGDAGVQALDLASGRVARRGPAGPVTAWAFAPDGRRALLATPGRLLLCAWPSGAPLGATEERARLDVQAMAWAGEGDLGAALFRGDRGPSLFWGVPANPHSWHAHLLEYQGSRGPPGDPAAVPVRPAAAFTNGGRFLTVFDWGQVLAFAPDAIQPLQGSENPLVRLPQRTMTGLAVSPDGALAAVGTLTGEVFLVELATGQEWLSWTGAGHGVRCLAFSPDGRRLATGSADGRVLVWDLTPGPPAAPSWEDLLAEDGPRAHAAVWAWARSGQAGLGQLRARVPVIPRDVAAVIEARVRNLGHERWALRDEATRELAALGELAVPALQRAALGDHRLEARRRAEQLLHEAAQAPELTPARCRLLRALEAVELQGSPEALALLTDWAAGLPDAWTTRMARASRARLARRLGVETVHEP